MEIAASGTKSLRGGGRRARNREDSPRSAVAPRLRHVVSVLDITRHDHADKAWDRFVEQHPHATVAHLAAWGSVFEGAYRHQRVYLVAEDSGDIAGVLPLVVIRSRLFGRCVVSMPFLDYGGILADPGSEA